MAHAAKMRMPQRTTWSRKLRRPMPPPARAQASDAIAKNPLSNRLLGALNGAVAKNLHRQRREVAANTHVIHVVGPGTRAAEERAPADQASHSPGGTRAPPMRRNRPAHMYQQRNPLRTFEMDPGTLARMAVTSPRSVVLAGILRADLPKTAISQGSAGVSSKCVRACLLHVSLFLGEFAAP